MEKELIRQASQGNKDCLYDKDDELRQVLEQQMLNSSRFDGAKNKPKINKKQNVKND